MAKHTDIQALNPGDRIVVECTRCNAKLSRAVVLVPDDTPCPQESEVPRLPAGSVQRSPDEPYRGAEPIVGLVLDRSDLPGLTLDENQMGCCGPDGREPNMRCTCGRTVATFYGDCWQAHYVYFPPHNIHIVRLLDSST